MLSIAAVYSQIRGLGAAWVEVEQELVTDHQAAELLDKRDESNRPSRYKVTTNEMQRAVLRHSFI